MSRIETDGSFIHVFNETALDIVMSEPDTIRDFTDCLAKKAAFLRSGNLKAAAGEENLVADYATRMTSIPHPHRQSGPGQMLDPVRDLPPEAEVTGDSGTTIGTRPVASHGQCRVPACAGIMGFPARGVIPVAQFPLERVIGTTIGGTCNVAPAGYQPRSTDQDSCKALATSSV